MLKKIRDLYLKFAAWYYDEWDTDPGFVIFVSVLILAVVIAALIGLTFLFIYAPIVAAIITGSILLIAFLIGMTLYIGEKAQ